jgi:diguanylate cyclase (GGDEF)-like protein/PAS domain S-box-containing protein
MIADPNTLLFDRLPIGAYRSTPAGRQLRANAALVRLNGYASEEEMLAATNDLERGWYIHPGRRQLFKALIDRDGQVTDFVSEVYRHKTRERIWVRETAYAVRDAQGQMVYYEGTVEDITERHLAANALADSETRWRLALDAAGDGVWDWRVQTGEEFYSDRLLHMFGFKRGELAHSVAALDERTHPDDLAQMAVDREAHFSGRTPTYVNEHRVRCKDGSWKWVLSRGMVVSRDAQGQPLRMIGTHTDITQRKHAEELIWHQAHIDALTGLPNRRMLRQRLNEALAHARQTESALAVVFMDLDNFKQVNDTLGHHEGDALLVEAAHRIQQHMGRTDTLARMGGDEFTLVLAGLPAGADPVALLGPRLDGLLDALQQPYLLGQSEVFVSASMGLAMYPADASQIEDLLRHADQALYAAKGAGRNRWCVFTPAMQAAAQWRARLDADLRTALEAGQLSVVYQPIVNMLSGRVCKAEALLRWHHPELGAISPAQFIPVAETSGQILALGDWVFTQAAHQVRHWRSVLDAEFQVSVNKSPVQCHRSPALSSRWVDELAQMGLPCSSLCIEITEGLLLDTHPDVTRHLGELRAAGMTVSLDDFGTGYSSLTYLQKLDIDCLKIDQSFVRNLSPGSTDLTLCKAIIAMAHELGMQVVAEGVETEQQHQLLMEAGCDHGQGYWYGRPMPPAQFEAWVRARQPL